MNENNSLKGLGLFMLHIIQLVSKGEFETINDVEDHIYNNSIVGYLFEKYSDKFTVDFSYENNSYNISYIDQFFTKNVTNPNKYGLTMDSNGLLFLLSIISDKVSENDATWSI